MIKAINEETGLCVKNYLKTRLEGAAKAPVF